MKATVYYVDLTEEQRNIINDPEFGGWGCATGRAYMAAKDGIFNDETRSFFVKAATIYAGNNEEIWMRLQNMDAPWTDDAEIEKHTAFPRSMDVGDLIVWEAGGVERCDRCGFQTVTDTFKELVDAAA